jgi:hypothetical protein
MASPPDSALMRPVHAIVADNSAAAQELLAAASSLLTRATIARLVAGVVGLSCAALIARAPHSIG